jgi:hypothetical protein
MRVDARQGLHPLRRLVRWVAILMLALAVLLSIPLFLLWMNTVPGANTLLSEVIFKSGLPIISSGSVEIMDLEGTRPESASQNLEIQRSSSEIIAAIVQVCRDLQLDLPDAMERSSEPDLMCRGYWRDRSVGVYLSTRCTNTCSANVTIRAM